MAETVDLTITVVSWNTRELLRNCLRSVVESEARCRWELHVVDNGSHDGSAAMVRAEFPDALLIANAENRGFAPANNQSWQQACGRYWMLLNSDTEVRSGALDALVAFMDAQPRAGLATARLVNPDGTPQYCALPTPTVLRTLLEASRLHKLLPVSVRGRILLSTYWTYNQPLQLGWTWGTALMARREAVAEVGPLCEEFFMYGEDLEWCLRMRQRGWEVWFCPQAEVLHYGGRSAARQWDSVGRLHKVWDGFYRALARHRHHLSLRSLQATTLLALGLEWLTSRPGGKSEHTLFLEVSMGYHLRLLRGKAPRFCEPCSVEMS